MPAPVFQRPRPRKEAVTLERVTRDQRLQQRDIRDAEGNPTLTDPRRVAELREAIALGAEMRPDAIAILRERKSGRVIDWLFRGFHTVEAMLAEGVNTAEAEVWEGDFNDALFFSLSENSRGEKNRTPEDCRKAFAQMIDSPDMMRRVYEAAEKHGGTLRAMRAACGLAESTISEYLRDRGLRVSRTSGRLIEAEREDPAAVERREQAAQLVSEGKTQREIAEAIGIPQSKVGALLKPPSDTSHFREQGVSLTDQNDAEENDDPATPTEPTPAAPTPDQPAPSEPEQPSPAAACRDDVASAMAHLRGLRKYVERIVGAGFLNHLHAAAERHGVTLPTDGIPEWFDECEAILGEADELLANDRELICSAPDPFARLASRTTSLATLFTRRLKGDDPDTAKLRAYLSACALVDHHTQAAVEGDEFVEARCRFLPLAGVSAVLDLAALPGPAKTDREVKAVYDSASGGFVPPVVARRRRERGSR